MKLAVDPGRALHDDQGRHQYTLFAKDDVSEFLSGYSQGDGLSVQRLTSVDSCWESSAS